jgi:hypothetical protein
MVQITPTPERDFLHSLVAWYVTKKGLKWPNEENPRFFNYKTDKTDTLRTAAAKSFSIHCLDILEIRFKI